MNAASARHDTVGRDVMETFRHPRRFKVMTVVSGGRARRRAAPRALRLHRALARSLHRSGTAPAAVRQEPGVDPLTAALAGPAPRRRRVGVDAWSRRSCAHRRRGVRVGGRLDPASTLAGAAARRRPHRRLSGGVEYRALDDAWRTATQR